MPPVNPFATSRTRPGALAYQFPDGQSAAALMARLETQGWRGEIVGPHGSGKSTLLATFAPLWSRVGRRPLAITLHEGQRRLPAEAWDGATIDTSTQIIIDGYEQLGHWARFRLHTLCRSHGCGLLITSHRSVGLPHLYQTYIDQLTLKYVVDCLTAEYGSTAEYGWSATPELLQELMASYHGNMREMLFHLYDVVELQRQHTE